MRKFISVPLPTPEHPLIIRGLYYSDYGFIFGICYLSILIYINIDKYRKSICIYIEINRKSIYL